MKFLIDDEPERKLHVEIKPITNGANMPSATVDELKATIEGFNINTSMFNTVVSYYIAVRPSLLLDF